MNTNTGVGLGGLLTIAFVVLKLTHVIAWSWWWVLAPAWAPLGLGLVWLVIQVVLIVVFGLREKRGHAQRRK